LLGNVIGAVEGNASSATKLISTTSFALTGDVSSAPVLFDGNASAPKEFNTVLSNTFISSKDEATLVDGGPLRIDSDDELLIDRPSAGLYKIKQRDLVASVPINPTGIFVPYGGAVAPPGWLLCDGSIVSQSMYTDLFNVIGHSFLDTAELVNLGLSSTLVFGLPDFRGRFPLGLDGMGGTAANRVTDNAADTLGNSGGNQTADVKKENLPEHQHDMQSDAGEQFYAIRNITSNTSADPQEIALNLSPGSNIATGIATSGDIDDGGFFDQSPTKGYRTVAGEELGAPLTTMNPYTAVNYIIWTGSV
jgi:microcystin-dependent protein